MAEHERLSRGQWLVLIAAFLGWMFDGVEIGLIPLVGRPALQDLLGLAVALVMESWPERHRSKMNQAVHSVDLLTWLMGPVVEVRAKIGLVAHERIEVEHVAPATLEFANGALGVIEASTAVYPGYPKRIEIKKRSGEAKQRQTTLGIMPSSGLWVLLRCDEYLHKNDLSGLSQTVVATHWRERSSGDALDHWAALSFSTGQYFL
jgi:hypothetical protein